MNHDGVHAGLLQKHDIAGEVLGELRVAHGVPAIFHHDRLPVVALHIGQGLGEDLGLGMHGAKRIRQRGAVRGRFVA